MRKIFILRAILQFMVFFMVLGGVALLIMIPLILFNSDWDIPVTISGNYVEEFTVGTKIIMVIGSIAYLLYVYAIFLLKKTIDLFIKKLLFDDKVIRNFNTIGKVFIVVALLTSVPSFFYHAYTNQKFKMDLTAYDSDSMLFNVAIGLFFITLSEVFKIAKIQKQENELTI